MSEAAVIFEASTLCAFIIVIAPSLDVSPKLPLRARLPPSPKLRVRSYGPSTAPKKAMLLWFEEVSKLADPLKVTGDAKETEAPEVIDPANATGPGPVCMSPPANVPPLLIFRAAELLMRKGPLFAVVALPQSSNSEPLREIPARAVVKRS